MSKKQKLTDLILGEVSLVDRGSNGGSHIMLIKRHADDLFDKGSNTVGKSTHAAWIADNPDKEPGEMPGKIKKQDHQSIVDSWLLIHTDKSIADLPEILKAESFNALMSARENEQDMWDKIYVLQDSLSSILRDEDIEDKQAAAAETLMQFHQSVLNSIMKDGSEPMDELQKLQKKFDDLKKEFDTLTTANETLTSANETLQATIDAAGTGDNDDGTGIDKSALPEAVRKVLDDQAVQLQAQGDTITKMQDEAVTKAFIEKAATFDKIPMTAIELGAIMKSASKAMSADEYTAFEGLLKAANEAQAKVFKEIGGDGNVAGNALEQLNVLAKTISDADGVTFEKGFQFALERNPELRKQYKDERRGTAQH